MRPQGGSRRLWTRQRLEELSLDPLRRIVLLGNQAVRRLQAYRPREEIAWIAAWLLLWPTLIALPGAWPDVGLDASWAHAYVYFFKHNLQAGRDYVFTFGPLGRFMFATFDPEGIVGPMLWDVGLKGLFAFLFVRVCRQMRGTAARLLFLAVALLLSSTNVDHLYLLALTFAG